MKVYVIYFEESWDIDSIFKDKKKAQDYILNRFREANPDATRDRYQMMRIAAMLENENYIPDFAEIEVWEVQK